MNKIILSTRYFLFLVEEGHMLSSVMCSAQAEVTEELEEFISDIYFTVSDCVGGKFFSSSQASACFLKSS